MDKKALNKALLALQNNHLDALDTVYKLTHKSVFSVSLSVVKNYEEACDLTQQTYLKIKEKIDLYKPNTNAYAWILTITKNLSINEGKKRAREVATDFDVTPFESETKELNIPVFRIAKQVLSPDELSIVLLYAVSGYKHREIAEILEKPLGTVLWAYRNALEKLRKNIGGDYER